MYKGIIRPLLFLLSPETVHNLVVALIKFLFAIPLVKPLVSSFYAVRETKLKRATNALKKLKKKKRYYDAKLAERDALQ